MVLAFLLNKKRGKWPKGRAEYAGTAQKSQARDILKVVEQYIGLALIVAIAVPLILGLLVSPGMVAQIALGVWIGRNPRRLLALAGAGMIYLGVVGIITLFWFYYASSLG